VSEYIKRKDGKREKKGESNKNESENENNEKQLNDHVKPFFHNEDQFQKMTLLNQIIFKDLVKEVNDVIFMII